MTSITMKSHFGHSNVSNPNVRVSSFMTARQFGQLLSVFMDLISLLMAYLRRATPSLADGQEFRRECAALNPKSRVAKERCPAPLLARQ
jgi:hypothetical protein